MQTKPAFHHFNVQHFCPVAQALEQLGDRWSFLVIRDLMRGPQRFIDLQRYLVGITPKRLTANLRSLEAEGIVERKRELGRREVWYTLTPKGRGLIPVIKTLAIWGIEHSTRTPSAGETVYPEHTMGVVINSLNQRVLLLSHPITWAVYFGEKGVFTIHFDGHQWDLIASDNTDADVHIETTPGNWTAFLLSNTQEERQHYLTMMRISGEQSYINELLDINWIA